MENIIMLADVLNPERKPIWVEEDGNRIRKKDAVAQIKEGYHAIYFALPWSNACALEVVVVTYAHKDYYNCNWADALDGFKSYLEYSGQYTAEELDDDSDILDNLIGFRIVVK